MSLLLAETVIQYCNLYRVVHIGGRFGGAKTSLAFRLAYEMVQRGWYRYICSNMQSVWSEPFDNVKLRDGIYADCVLVLDEGGLFLETGKDAKEFMSFLRKLNIAILIPSVTPPATKLRSLTVQRLINFSVWGIPAFMYHWELSSGVIKEKGSFFWWHPSEIYGIYNTMAVPMDDGGLSKYMVKWVAEMSAVEQGNGTQIKQVETYQEYNENSSGSGLQADRALARAILAELRGVVGEFADIQEETSAKLSLLEGQRKRRRR